ELAAGFPLHHPPPLGARLDVEADLVHAGPWLRDREDGGREGGAARGARGRGRPADVQVGLLAGPAGPHEAGLLGAGLLRGEVPQREIGVQVARPPDRLHAVDHAGRAEGDRLRGPGGGGEAEQRGPQQCAGPQVHARAARGWAGRWRGRVTVNRLPWPGRLLTSSRPWWRRTISRTR